MGRELLDHLLDNIEFCERLEWICGNLEERRGDLLRFSIQLNHLLNTAEVDIEKHIMQPILDYYELLESINISEWYNEWKKSQEENYGKTEETR